jgi:hypothetical protein
MKTKLHFGLLVILLAFLGTYLEQTTVPNQQIVIQFLDKDIAKEDADKAIEIVKDQLESIGVELIQIDQNDGGQLKITYYSTSDVERVQRLLLKGYDFRFAYDSEEKSTTDFPESKPIKNYELNISEIQNGNHTNWDFERTEIVQFNQKSDNSYNPRVNASGFPINDNYNNGKIRIAIQINSEIVIAKNNQSYKIPECRAGPNSKGII